MSQKQNNNYFSHYFPKPQYLGSKYTLLNWIGQYVPDDVNTVMDAFSGSQSVSYFLKQMGKRVYTNDFLNSCHQIGVGLIENKCEILDDNDLKILFDDNEKQDNLMVNNFTDIFFIREETEMLDRFRANVEKLASVYKRALSISVMNRAMQRKVIMGHFAHTKALEYSANPERVKRNKSISLPLKDLFMEQLPKYNQAVFDNGKDNKSFNCNILDLLPQIDDIDLIYIDPPYTNSHSDYQSFYHLLETYSEYWSDKEFINGTRRYHPSRFSGFDKKADVIKSLNKLFEAASEIPTWLISWNDRSFPSVVDFTNIIKKYRNVEVIIKPYTQSRGGKGSVKGSHEILFICSNKINELQNMSK